MNILVVAHYQNDSSPTAIFIHDQVLAYAAAGHNVRVIVPIPIGKRGYEGKRLDPLVLPKTIDGITHYFLRHLSFSQFGERGWNRRCAILSMKLSWKKVLRGFAPDVIHAHTLGTDSELGAWLKNKLGKPLVITTHGSDTFIRFNQGEKAEIKRFADKGDVVVSVSSLLKKRLQASGVTTNLSVILNGFQLQYVCDNTCRQRHAIVQVGNLIPRKKNDVTIRALALLEHQFPDAKLAIVGDGVERSNLEELCRQLKVEEKVLFCGYLPNQEALSQMAKAQFFCMPSVQEGFGIVYLEAMASGCIAIGTEGEGIADLIRDGENGFLVPPDDPEAIARVIEWCLAHPEELAAIADRGRTDALSLTWQKNAAEYYELFESLIERYHIDG